MSRSYPQKSTAKKREKVMGERFEAYKARWQHRCDWINSGDGRHCPKLGTHEYVKDWWYCDAHYAKALAIDAADDELD